MAGSTTGPARGAAVLLGLEALALVVLAGVQLVAIAGGDTASLPSAIALAVMTGIGAAAVGAFAVAVWRGQSWGRSGGIVVQALLFGVAVGAATGAYAHPLIGLALAVPAVAVFVLIVLAARGANAAASDDPA